jgi:hypothetical protein
VSPFSNESARRVGPGGRTSRSGPSRVVAAHARRGQTDDGGSATGSVFVVNQKERRTGSDAQGVCRSCSPRQ